METFIDRKRIYDAIRHLTASILYELGYEIAMIQSISRHRSPGTTERYLRSVGLERVRGALEDLSQGKGKVIELKSKKRGRPKSVSKK